MRAVYKKTVSIILCAALASSGAALALGQGSEAPTAVYLSALSQKGEPYNVISDKAGTTKEETVYLFLNPDGSVRSQTVSGWLHNADGLRGIGEPTALTNVKNVKGDLAPTLQNGVLCWDTDDTDVYYQGNAALTPPVTMSVSYTLDGRKMAAADMAGRSGRMTMTIQFQNHTGASESVNGRMRNLVTPFLAAAVCILPTDTFKNVDAGTLPLVSEGNSQIVAMAALPGLKESMGESYDALEAAGLTLEDSFTISADVTDFSMGSIMGAVTNELPLDSLKQAADLDELTRALDDMQTAAGQLQEGAAALADGSGTLSEKMGDLTAGADALSAGVDQLHTGTEGLQAGTDALQKGAGQLEAGVDAYTRAVTGLFSDLKTQLPALEQKIKEIQTAVTGQLEAVGGDAQAAAGEMKQIMTQLAVLTGQIDALEQTGVDTSALKQTALNLYDSLQEHISTLQTLGSDVQTLAGTTQNVTGELEQRYTALKEKLAVMDTTLTEQSTALSKGAGAVAQGAGQLVSGADQLASGVEQLQDGKDTLAAGANQLEAAAGTLHEKTEELAQGMRQFKSEGVDALRNRADDLTGALDDLMAVKDALIARAEAYDTYAGSPAGADSTVKFVLKTDPVQRAETTETAAQPEETVKTSLWQRIVDLFKRED